MVYSRTHACPSDIPLRPDRPTARRCRNRCGRACRRHACGGHGRRQCLGHGSPAQDRHYCCNDREYRPEGVPNPSTSEASAHTCHRPTGESAADPLLPCLAGGDESRRERSGECTRSCDGGGGGVGHRSGPSREGRVGGSDSGVVSVRTPFVPVLARGFDFAAIGSGSRIAPVVSGSSCDLMVFFQWRALAAQQVGLTVHRTPGWCR